MMMLFANTFKSVYYKHLIGNLAQQFFDTIRITERIEQSIKMGKIGCPIMGSRTMTGDKSKDGSRVGNLSYVDLSGLVIASTTQMHLS